MEQTFNEHIKELLSRLKNVIIFSVCVLLFVFLFSKTFLNYYIKYLSILTYSFDPLEEIQALMNISISITLLISLSYMIYQLYMFIRPAFKIDKPLLILSSMIIVSTISYIFGSTVIAKMLLENLYNDSMFIQQWSLLKILRISSMVGIAFAFSSLITYLIPFIVKMNIIKLENITKIRKYYIIIMLILSGIITPTGDIISLSVTFIPIYLAYEIGILITKITGGKLKWYGEYKKLPL
jgi:sec-independent protein translocase protein TatC